MTLQRLMGLKSFAVSGDLIFGIRQIKVWFISDGTVPEFRTERVADNIS